MRAFLLVWTGQTVSSIGTTMTSFALGLWLFERTGQATALALVVLSSAVPQILLTLLAGPIVDRFSRKGLMIAGDILAAGVTVFYLALLAAGPLPEGAVYLGAALLGTVGRVQMLAYDTAITALVPKHHYMRAGAMLSLTGYASDIMAPASAAALYPVLGLAGILWLDLLSYGVAVTATGLTRIPRIEPRARSTSEPPLRRAAHDLAFGFRVIWASPALRLFLLINLLFSFSHDFTHVLYTPMILARTGNDATVVATWTAAMGLGGILMSLIVSATGGPRRRVAANGWATLLAGVGKLFVGLGQNLTVWIPAQFGTSMNFPMRGSAWSAIWRSHIDARAQGRVFAVTGALLQTFGAFGVALAGPLADRFFEPAMMPGGALAGALGGLFGTGPGAGMSLAIVLFAPGMILTGILTLRLPLLRTLGDDPPEPSPPLVLLEHEQSVVVPSGGD